MVGGDDPFYLKYWVKLTRLERKRQFQSIFARSASAVTPSEKVQLSQEVHYALSSEPKMNIVPKTPNLKNVKRPFSVYNRSSLEESLLQSFFV